MPSALPLALKQVQRALSQHRQDFGRQRIPDRLRRRVLALLPAHPRKQVVNTLGISYKMLCSWERQQTPLVLPDSDRELPIAAPAFVSVSLPGDEASDSPGVVSSGPLSIPCAATGVSSTPITLRIGTETTLGFTGHSASAHCLLLLQGLGYSRDPQVEPAE